jgi:nucleotide-binding universal stress UspA family protein
MLDHILVPLDGSALAEEAIPHGVAVASAFNAELTLLRVVEQSDSSRSIDPLDWHIQKTEADSYLETIAARLREDKVHVEKVLLEGRAANLIIEFAHNHNTDLIVLSAHGKSGSNDWTVGSTVQKAIQGIGRSIFLVRPSQPALDRNTALHYKRILVPLDGSLRAEHVLPIANTLASHHQSQVLLVHVVDKPELPRRTPLTQEETDLINRLVERNQEEGTRYLEQLQSRLTAGVQTRLLVSDNATVTLHDLAMQENIDLVILSAHGYSGEARWPYGSVVTSFLFYGNAPLMIVQDLPTERPETQQSETIARTPGHA